MDAVRRKVNRLECMPSFCRRKSFLAARNGSFQSHFIRTFNPDLEIEVFAIAGLEQKDSFKQNDVNVVKNVAMFVGKRGFGIAAIDKDIYTAVIAQRKNQPLEHFVEADCVTVKLLREVLWSQTKLSAHSTNHRPISARYSEISRATHLPVEH
jgi:hypothetical protein